MLLHQFDGLEDWEGGDRGYRPCHHGWCAGRYDHVSVSLINKDLSRVFNGAGGIILSPSTRFNCSFPHDGGTQSRGIRDACALGTAYAPHRLKAMMEEQLRIHKGEYNEFVVAAKFWDDHLPSVVEAVMYVHTKDKALRAHRAFLRDFGRTASQVPLVRYVPGSGFVEG